MRYGVRQASASLVPHQQPRHLAHPLGHPAVRGSRVVVKIDVAHPTGDHRDRDVTLAHHPIREPYLPVAGVLDASDAHAQSVTRPHPTGRVSTALRVPTRPPRTPHG